MRVLQINSVVGYGSTGRIAVNLAKELMKNGHECCIAYGRRKGAIPDDISTIRIGTDLDVIIHGIMSRLTDKHGFYSVRATEKFAQWIRRYNPDVIQLHNLHGYYINLPILFRCLREINKPVIWTLHDCWAFTGHCAHFDFAGCERWKRECYNCIQKKEYPSSWLCDNSKKNYITKKAIFTALSDMVIITPSQWLCKLVQESFLKKYKVKVVNNGIDLSVFKYTQGHCRDKYGLTGKKIVLGVANIWDERKGLSDFLRLSDKLDDAYSIVLIGLNKHQMKLIKPNMVGIMRTSSVKELAEWYSASDVYVNATSEDNYPTTNLEALACGTPVITYRTGGSAESVPKECGKVVDKGKIEQLCLAIEEVVKRGITKTICMQNAEQYNINLQFGKYIDIYADILKNQRE